MRGNRAIGSSRIQADLVHNYRIRYDYFFDTAEVSLDQMVQEIVSACKNQTHWQMKYDI